MADITMEIGNTLDVEIGATPQQLLPLIETNNKLATSVKTLSENNKTLAETCQDQSATTEQLAENNRTLADTNKSLSEEVLPILRNGLQSKTVQPNEREQVVTADEGYIGLKDVTVKQSEYVPTIGWFGSINTAYEGEIHAILDMSTRTSCASMFYNCSKLTGIYKIINTQNVTSMASMFSGCSSLKEIDLSGWDTSNVTSMVNLARQCDALASLDMHGIDFSKVTSLDGFLWKTPNIKRLDMSGLNFEGMTTLGEGFDYVTGLKWCDFSGIKNCYYLTKPQYAKYNYFGCRATKTWIGDHTLAEVEAGLTCFEGIGCTETIVTVSGQVYYSSILALGNGIYDRSDMAAGTWQLSNSAFTYMRNDDDTIPDAATVTARQTRIREIAAAKNYTLSLS